MSNKDAAFKSELESVILFKFGTLDTVASNKKTALDIVGQVVEMNSYESIYHPVMKAELVVNDTIGLFVNYPLTGEEAVKITYRTGSDGALSSRYYVIESIGEITVADDGRSTIFTMNLVAIEMWANSLRTIQKTYTGQSHEAVKSIIEEYIQKPLQKILVGYNKQSPIFTEPSDNEVAKLIIIPNIHPLSAVSLVADYATPKSSDAFTYLFYQTESGFHFKTIQSMFLHNRADTQRRNAIKRKYKYISDEVEDSKKMSNDSRIVTNLSFNRRHSTLDKIGQGYFQNNLVEINIAQKAYYTKKWTAEDNKFISNNKLNTDKYHAAVKIEGDSEVANRVRYVINNQSENDISYPVSDLRERWGRDIIARVAMAQVDITITIPGTREFSPSDLFYLEIPEVHGFNENKEDDLVSGYFLITEIAHTINANGIHSTSMRLNKDSYDTSIDRTSRY
jgi:hypothetical protein